MSDEQKQDIREMVEILNGLNAEDLALIKGGVMVLKAKQDMNDKEPDDGGS